MLALSQGKFGMIAVSQFAPTSLFNLPIRLPQNRTNKGTCFVIGARFIDGLSHCTDGPLHHLPTVKFCIDSHGGHAHWELASNTFAAIIQIVSTCEIAREETRTNLRLPL